MILMLVPLVALVLGMVFGGHPAALARLPIHWGGVALLTLTAQWLLVRVPGTAPDLWLGAAFLASYAVLLAFLWVNRTLPGMKLALVGTLLNLVVMAANGGYMPIAPEILAQRSDRLPAAIVGQRLPMGKDIVLPPDRAVLAGLGDALTIRWPIKEAFSIGDVALIAGVGALVFIGMRPVGRRKTGRFGLVGRSRIPQSEGFPAEGRSRPSAVGDHATAE